jgi:sec-independent protein translocase protein TatB
MFGLDWGELLVVIVVALVVVGPKDLPRLMRIIGRWVGKARAMADQFKQSFDEMARESELDELRKEIEALRRSNPLTRAQEELNRTILPPGGPVVPAVPPPSTPPPDAEAAELGEIPHDKFDTDDGVHEMHKSPLLPDGEPEAKSGGRS